MKHSRHFSTVVTGTAALLLGAIAALTPKAAQAQVTLGAFTFNASQFGDTLGESDGGAFRNNNWLNVVNANPGNPGALTGANFDTGIANIPNTVTYTIGYSTPIVNDTGNDFGVVAGFDTFAGSEITLSVSTDGINFVGAQTLSGGRQSTGEFRSYFYGGGGPFSTELFVLPLDLSSFGIASGQSISAVRFTGGGAGADVVRVAGFGTGSNVAAPEPATLALLATGLLPVLGAVIRRRKR